MKLALIAAAILAALFATIVVTTDHAHASVATQVIIDRATTAPSCNGQRCVQTRTITYSTHGQGLVVVHKRRTAPAESRTPTQLHPWRPWRITGVAVMPYR